MTAHERGPAARHCILLPFYNRLPMVARCLTLLLEQALDTSFLVLVDDGSVPPADSDPALRRLMADDRVVLLRHSENRGVSAARNTALEWCRQQRMEIVIMIDSDCEPSPDFIKEHLRMHAEDPAATCIGAAVEGVGEGFWARVDRVMTWHHLAGRAREVRHPYHLGTTNFSVKFERLPVRRAVFDERLNTGEDALLIRELRRNGHRILFAPTPRIVHRDRETFCGVLWHHYQYGHHQYFIQLGGDLSPRCFNPAYRAAFVLAFLPVLPFFALAGTALNLLPWLRERPSYALYYPLMYLLWLSKGVAVLESSVAPWRTLRPVRINGPSEAPETPLTTAASE